MKKLVYLFIFSTYLIAFSFNNEQLENLDRCFTISKKMKNDPYLTCSIMLNESSALEKEPVGDMFLKPFKRSYGIMQIRLNTAKHMIEYFKLKKYKKLPDEIILAKLMFDKNFSIEIANYYVKYLRKKYLDDVKVAVAYNSGYYNRKNISYKKRYLKNRKLLEKYYRR